MSDSVFEPPANPNFILLQRDRDGSWQWEALRNGSSVAVGGGLSLLLCADSMRDYFADRDPVPTMSGKAKRAAIRWLVWKHDMTTDQARALIENLPVTKSEERIRRDAIDVAEFMVD